MKKLTLIIVALSIVILSCVGLAACAKDAPTTETTPDNGPTPVTVTIYIGDTAYENIEGYSNENLFSHLEAICKANELLLQFSGSSYGAFIEKIDTLVPDAAKFEFISIYTTDENNKDVSPACETITKGEHTLFTSGLGASSLKLVDSAVYAIDITTWA